MNHEYQKLPTMITAYNLLINHDQPVLAIISRYCRPATRSNQPVHCGTIGRATSRHPEMWSQHGFATKETPLGMELWDVWGRNLIKSVWISEPAQDTRISVPSCVRPNASFPTKKNITTWVGHHEGPLTKACHHQIDHQKTYFNELQWAISAIRICSSQWISHP